MFGPDGRHIVFVLMRTQATVRGLRDLKQAPG
jgi:hypothetical protein